MSQAAIRPAALQCIRTLTRIRQPSSVAVYSGSCLVISRFDKTVPAGRQTLGRAPFSITTRRTEHTAPPDQHSATSKPGVSIYDDHFGMKLDIDPCYFKPDAPWGLVVYRTCYDDEAAWQRLRAEMANLHEERWNPDDMYIAKRHRIVFMDDKARFDRADRAKLRDHFDHWVTAELERNLTGMPVSDLMEDRAVEGSTRSSVSMGTFGPRYNIFGVADDVCIESMRRNHPGPLLMLVRRDWEPITEHQAMHRQGGPHPDFDEGFMVDHSEGPGGWIYTAIIDYTENYHRLGDLTLWYEDDIFMYPSEVYGGLMGMGLDKSPGFWREEMAVERGRTGTTSQDCQGAVKYCNASLDENPGEIAGVRYTGTVS